MISMLKFVFAILIPRVEGNYTVRQVEPHAW
jgi:hypothetical protein